ncbi:MAG: zinc ribbon domain-containing protein [Clostridiales bacterium]|nr:zinc ribbon domain-containing protein [Clostridiales bacterium]
MAMVVCPQCGKEVDSSEGYCVYCGYTFDDGELKSPFASAYNQAQADAQFEETSGGSPVIRFDSNSYADTVPMSSGRSSGDLMFGIGLSRILAIFFAALVIIAMIIPFVSVRIVIPKTALPSGFNTSTLVRAANDRNFKYNDDGKDITIGRSVSLITSPNYFLYLMAGACVTGIIFAIKGKPAVYLVCGIGGGLLGFFNYTMNFSSIDAITKSTYFAKLETAMAKTGITMAIDKGAGAYLLLFGCIGMIVAAIIFLNNHAAYDE